MPQHETPHRRACSHTRYKLSCAEYDELMHQADYRCQLCHRSAGETGHGHLVVDHDFRVGDWAGRGILCSTCNGKIEYTDSEDPARAAYLGNPWYRRMLASRGLRVELAEPPLGTTVHAGRRTWRRTPNGWCSLDRYRGRALTWAQIHRRFGPHNITLLD
ncbi:endonuclease VII domain-containing protein (plasmid) [Streptomyces canus]|uniref:endonuclease domain-containing protein n=1 Tax=Streptomyces canus TaxID=58343 RepID=UPI002F9091C8|nr:endonuclease VII domain-containing protein [Streptomyces canus]